ncbi:hypothetical protein [Yersinia vastinensis]|uniref:hypothetical protein n=1 Tax=Yersinia vastinensis TaxID=2890318 RepID=UPI0011A82D95|nr:hypothetical protein [Yersinia vastinensis]
MADKNSIDGIPPLDDIAGGKIPAYKKIPGAMVKAYKLANGVHTAYTISSELLGLINKGASNALIVNNAAQGVGVPVEQFGDVTGAMRIRGVDNIEAIKSTQKLYKRLNDIAWGHNKPASELFTKHKIDIILNDNGTVDAPKTMTNYATAYAPLSPRDKSELDNVIEFDSNEMLLPREGTDLNSLFTRVKTFGLDVDPEYNKKAVTLEHEKTKLKAAKEGWLQQFNNNVTSPFLFDDILANITGRFSDLIAYDFDESSFITNWMNIDGYNLLKKQQAQSDPDFLDKLNTYELFMLNFPGISGSVKKKMHEHEDLKKNTQRIGSPVADSTISQTPYPQTNLNQQVERVNQSIDDIWMSDNSQISDSDIRDTYSIEPATSPNDNIVSHVTNISPIYSEATGGFNADVIADVIATAMQNNRVEIELTLIDSRTGETSEIQAQGGGRISYAMVMPM